MDALLVASALLDCVAVAGIGWLLKRSEDLARLVSHAEERTRGLAAALDARERRLRVLIAQTERANPAEARLLRDLEPLGVVRRLGDDELKIPNGRADTPVGKRQAAVRGSSDEGQ